MGTEEDSKGKFVAMKSAAGGSNFDHRPHLPPVLIFVVLFGWHLFI
jgi:hypothetical protein